MSYRIDPRAPVQAEIRRIAREQLRRAIRETHASELSLAERIHQVRKRCKKLRGLLRLVRPVALELYRSENECFRDLSRMIGGARDLDAMLGTYDLFMEGVEDGIEGQRFRSIRRHLENLRNAFGEEELSLRLATVHGELQAAAERVKRWSIPAEGFEALAGGLKKTYGRAARAMRDARKQEDAEVFHEWRKRVKYHWYHTRLLRALWEPVLKARAKEARRLADLLGRHHDLWLLQARLRDVSGGVVSKRDLEAFMALLDSRRVGLEDESWDLGLRLFAEKPKQLARQWESWWEEIADGEKGV